ncbi:protein lifeguard 1-like [Sycon ciliatum]|uniref:protein lifeguard 1-like n=1 Tax=Sycon ciliatum TaxID=27933 RepID=UPI0020AE8CCD|eukprot:scpid86812/ scgid33518/ Protein lifeguard 1; Glutamate [NMDA] receptor-associated protein 1; NMDA receptor glutamate-binding subunit; Putative MAPK-activating protein PM02; Transmembrane BAX inhibitor motif-containing protein 3
MSSYDSLEAGGMPSFSSFDEKSVRLGFIRKVYAILFVQLAVTFGFVILFSYVDSIQQYCEANAWMWGLALGLQIATLIALACCGQLRRKHPHNIILLGVFTLAESFLLGTFAAHFRRESVVSAVAITALVVLAVSLFACQTKYDFTTCGGFLFVSLFVLIGFGFMTIFFHSNLLNILYGALGALLFTMFLAYDTQLLMGGRTVELSPEEYIFAALNLYIDIVQIFIYILALFGDS